MKKFTIFLALMLAIGSVFALPTARKITTSSSSDNKTYSAFETGTMYGALTDWTSVPAVPTDLTATTAANLKNTWHLSDNLQMGITPHSGKGMAAIRTGSENAADSWLHLFGRTENRSTTSTPFFISFWVMMPDSCDRLEVVMGRATGAESASPTVSTSTILLDSLQEGASSRTVIYTTPANTEYKEWTLITASFLFPTQGCYFIGFHVTTPAGKGSFVAIDDINFTMNPNGTGVGSTANLANDLGIKPVVSPYGALPTGFLLPYTNFTAEVANYGYNAQTNVKVQVGYATNASGASGWRLLGESETVASLAPSASVKFDIPLTGSVNFAAANNRYIVYKILKTGTDNATSDNTSYYTLALTANTYNAHGNANAAYTTKGAKTEKATWGNVYEVGNPIHTNRISITGGASDAQNIRVAIYKMDHDTIIPTAIVSKDTSITTESIGTFSVNFPVTELTKGKYFVCVEELDDATNGIAIYGDGVAGRYSYSLNGNRLVPEPRLGGLAIGLYVGIANEIELTSVNPEALPYASIPVSQGLLLKRLSATAENLGMLPATGVKATALLNNELIEESAIVDNIAPGETKTLHIDLDGDYTIKQGNNTLTVELTSESPDADEDNNSENLTTFTGTDGLFAVEKLAANVPSYTQDYTGVNEVTYGNIFEITKQTVMTGASLAVYAPSENTYTVSLYRTDGDTVETDFIHQEDVYAGRGWITIPFPEILLAPGKYYLCVMSNSSTVLARILHEKGAAGYQKIGNELSSVANKKLGLRMIIDDNISQLQNDLSVEVPYQPSQLPVSQKISANIKVRNNGSQEQTNVNVQAFLDGTLVGTSDIIDKLAPKKDTTVNFSTALPELSEGENRIMYVVSGDATDEINANDTVKLTIEGTEHVFAADRNASGDDAHPNVGSGNEIGNIFEVTETVILSQFLTRFGTPQGMTELSLYKLKSDTVDPAAPMLFSEMIARRTGAYKISTPKIELTPGFYYLAVRQSGNDALYVYHDDLNTGSASYTRKQGENTLEKSITYGAMRLQMLVDMPAVVTSFTPSFPYSKVPISMTAIFDSVKTVRVEIRNDGRDTVHNVQVQATMGEGTTPVFASVPTTLNPFSAKVIEAELKQTLPTAKGTYTLNFALTQDETNTVLPAPHTATFNYEITDAEYAFDHVTDCKNTAGFSQLQIMATKIGNVFEIKEQTELSKIVVGFGTGSTQGSAANQYSIALYRAFGDSITDEDGKKGVYIWRTNTMIKPTPENAGFVTIDVPEQTTLNVGRYYMCVFYNQNVNLAVASDYTAAPMMYVYEQDTLKEIYGYGAPAVRMILQKSCEKPYDLAVENTRPYAKFSWDGEHVSYKVMIVKDGQVIHEIESTTDKQIVAAADYFDQLLAGETYELVVIGICDPSYPNAQDTSRLTFTMAADVINMEVIGANGFPTNGYNMDEYTNLQIGVKNNSTTPLSNVPVKLVVDGELIIVDTIKATIAMGAEQWHYFTTNGTDRATIDLSAPGEHVVLAFVDQANESDYSDDTITHLITNTTVDVQAVEFTSHEDGLNYDLTANETVTVKVKNNGSAAVSDAIVRLVVDDAAPKAEMISVAAGAEDEVSFTGIDFAEEKVYELTAFISSYANDRDLSNDTIRLTIDHRSSSVEAFDVEVLNFTTPDTAGYDLTEETVTVTVKNNGNTVVRNVPIALIVDENQPIEEQIDSLQAGEQISYEFAAKADLTTYGMHNLTVFTTLANDENRANDTVRRAVNNHDESAVAGLEEVLNVKIYPNPVSEQLFIQSDEIVKRAEIYDLQGKLVMEVRNNVQSVSVNNLKAGTYVLRLYTEKGIVVQQFIKQ